MPAPDKGKADAAGEEAPAAKPEPAPKRHVATERFSAYYKTQLLTHEAGDELDPVVGAWLKEHGAPVEAK